MAPDLRDDAIVLGVRPLTLHTAGVLVAILAWAQQGCHRPAPAAATLEMVTGQVTVKRGDKTLVGRVGGGLQVGDVVVTGVDGGATIVLQQGRRVTLGVGSQVVVANNTLVAGAIGLILKSGRLKADSGAEGGLVVDTIFGRIRTRPELTVLDVDLDRGIQVELGRLDVERTNSLVELAAGQKMTVDGLVLAHAAAGEVKVGGVDLGAQTSAGSGPVATLAGSHGAQVAGPGQKAFRRAPASTPLKAGDRVRLAVPASPTQVVFAPEQVLQLQPGSEIELVGGTAVRPTWRLHAGAAALTLRRGASDPDPAHTLQLGERLLRVAPGMREADVRVAASAASAGHAEVRLGQVWEGGSAIKPGYRRTFHAGGPKTEPFTDYRVDISRGATSLAFQDTTPAVNLQWGHSGSQAVVELARDPDFADLLLAEAVDEGHLLTDRAAQPGSYFWRLRAEPAQVSRFEVQPEQAAGCLNCGSHNEVEDTGKRTTIYYQGSLPAISLKGSPVPGASRYLCRVFAADAAETAAPVIKSTSRQPVCRIAAGKLPEGHYQWSVQAAGGAGPRGSGRLNPLDLQFDLVLDSLQLRVPRRHMQTHDAALDVTGSLRPGLRLWLQDAPVAVEPSGHFATRQPLSPGLNVLVFRAEGEDKVTRLWARRVIRS